MPKIKPTNDDEVDSALSTLPINQIMNVLECAAERFRQLRQSAAERSEVEGHRIRERRTITTAPRCS